MNQILFSLDTTYSMYPAFSQIRSCIDTILPKIIQYIGPTSFGAIVHNDYTDEDTYVLKKLPLSAHSEDIIKFVKSIQFSDKKLLDPGIQKAYELSFLQANKFTWDSIYSVPKILCLVGNGIPHDFDFTSKSIIWRDKLQNLRDKGVKIVGVQMYTRRNKTVDNFFRELVDKFGASVVRLRHSAYIKEAIVGVILHAWRNDLVSEYISELSKQRILNEELKTYLEDILRKKSLENTLSNTSQKYQIMKVYRDITLKELYRWSGLERFRPENGFIQLKSPKVILPQQELLSEYEETGELFDNSTTRKTLDIIEEVKVNPLKIDKYRIFVRASSLNNKLYQGTHFIYED